MVRYVYTLGAAGERLKVTELDRIVEYSYDNLYRLVSEKITEGKKTTSYAYEYDDVSNRTLKIVNGKTTVYTYNELNQLVSENDIVYEYDLNGNAVRLTSPAKSALYTYDADNRLIRATVQSGNNVSVEEYKYDYAGNRIAKISEGEYTKYLLDINGSLTYVLAELDYSGKEKCYYTRADELISQERDGKISYYVYDGHGSVRALTNADGDVTDRYVFDAFGNLISSYGSTKNDFLFAGEQFDPVTGLYYLRARYMNPSVGTFISMDSYAGSIDDPVSLHKYLYCGSDPVNYVDPSGYNRTKTLTDLLVDFAVISVITTTLLTPNFQSVFCDSVQNIITVIEDTITYIDETIENIIEETKDIAGGGTDSGDVNEEQRDSSVPSEEPQSNESEPELPHPDYPGNDPTKSPGDDWEWRGPKDKGSWFNPKTGETLQPDLNHTEPEGPHWDYIPRKNGPQYRIFPDGHMAPKIPST